MRFQTSSDVMSCYAVALASVGRGFTPFQPPHPPEAWVHRCRPGPPEFGLLKAERIQLLGSIGSCPRVHDWLARRQGVLRTLPVSEIVLSWTLPDPAKPSQTLESCTSEISASSWPKLRMSKTTLNASSHPHWEPGSARATSRPHP